MGTRHPFDEALVLEPRTPQRVSGHTSEAYWNMVGPYGGITAAAMLQAMLDRPERQGEPLSFTINYLAPIAAGEFAIETELVRANRSNQHWTIRLLQGDAGDEKTLALAIAICAQRREVWSHVDARRPDVPPPDACPPAPPRRAEGFLLRYQFRPVRGLPFAENPDSHSEAWVQDVPPRPLDFASLTAICDSFLPRIFLRRREFTPIGTVSMNIYFHAGGEELARHGDAPLLTVADGQAFSDGHFDHNGLVCSRHGELLASTHQLVWYKE